MPNHKKQNEAKTDTGDQWVMAPAFRKVKRERFLAKMDLLMGVVFIVF
jgi:hypothetical protein